MNNAKDYFYTLGKAIDRLKEVLEHQQLDQIGYIRDATIQRFEFTIELFWKALKKILLHEKIESTTPHDTLNKAYQYKLIDNKELWLQMMDDRNNIYCELKGKYNLIYVPLLSATRLFE